MGRRKLWDKKKKLVSFRIDVDLLRESGASSSDTA